MDVKDLICVHIPYNIRISYTLFSLGHHVGKPTPDKNGDFLVFSYVGTSIFLLFYTFPGFRRVYVVTEANGYADKKKLPGVDGELRILWEGRGRKYDLLKKAMFVFTDFDKFEVFSFPPEFWIKLTNKIEAKKISEESLWFLYRKYSHSIKDG